jgi:O-antigen/teichoic acid export membrane protein
MRDLTSHANMDQHDGLRAIDAVSGTHHMSAAQLRTATVESAPTTTGVIQTDEGGEAGASADAPTDLRRKTVRGALVSSGAQAATFVLRTASLMVLARLLLKEDFGMVNMVTAFTGLLGLLMDAGLSDAAVQRASITRAQTSTLFWINLAVGGMLALLAAVTAPILAAFYGEPRLYWVTVALGTSFILNGAAAQHRAILQRSMRFAVLAIIDIVSLVVSIAAGIGMAVAGHGYWALVAMAISQPAVSVLGVWLATGWIPGMPQWRSGIRSMLVYGGTVTLNNFIVYLAFNVDKILIGRFWGAEALGVYGRAYQLINLPTGNLNSTFGSVAFPALSRVQNDPARLRHYFLKGYSLFLSLVIPMTIGCALFADDIILVFLGPKWREAAGIFRLLAPTILAFAFANPFFWLMLATGRAGRSLRVALLLTPALILSYALGLKHGPQGVAMGFSITMLLAIVPVVLWAKHGTLITMRDILTAVTPSSVSITIGAAATLAVRPMVDPVDPAFVRLVAESTILFGVYLFSLLFIMKQKPVYMGLLRQTGLWPVGSRWMEGEKA